MQVTKTLETTNTVRPPVNATRIQDGRCLADYYSPDTQYFYGYPAGEEAGFLNNVPPEVEELVAARTFSCAGPDMSVVCFAATCAPYLDGQLIKRLRIPQLAQHRIITLPASIDRTLHGSQRNEAIKQALQASIASGKLVMAQPFTDDYLAELYAIPPELTLWLNDKKNLTTYLDESVVPQRLGSFSNGRQFVAHKEALKLPYVAKASSSSSGDGVFICLTESDAALAAERLGKLDATIIVEQYIRAVKNYGVHFGVPKDSQKPIDILGINEQLTSKKGEFLGGIINSTEIPDELQAICAYIQSDLMPAIRKRGWHGVGCFDVLIDEQGKAYFIDCNFRMTGMSAYHFLVSAKKIHAPLISFSGTFEGDQASFEAALTPFDTQLQIISLNHDVNSWSFNAALMHDSNPKELIGQLLARGIASDGLSQFAQRS